MDKKAAIIIVNWNGLRFLNDCFTALSIQTYQNFDVYFVDNASKDESISFVQKNFPKTKIVALKENTGFAGGTNAGILEALKDKDVEYIVFLNNDTIVEKEWLRALVAGVEYKTKTEMVSSKSFFTDGNIQTIGLRFTKDLMGNNVGGLSIGYGEPPEHYSKSIEIFAPSGVSALYTRHLLEDVGLLDTDFFAYSEDLDLGLRAHNKGYKCIFVPDSRLVHLHSQTSGGEASPLKAFLIKRNNFFVAIKNFGFFDLILFPFRDIAWSVRKIFNKKSTSVNKLQGKIGTFGLLKIMVRVYAGVIWYGPKMFYKRFKAKKY